MDFCNIINAPDPQIAEYIKSIVLSLYGSVNLQGQMRKIPSIVRVPRIIQNQFRFICHGFTAP